MANSTRSLTLFKFILCILASGVAASESAGRGGLGTLKASRIIASERNVVTAAPFITANETLFGANIEAAAVNQWGSIFASNFQGVRSSYGEVACLNGTSIEPCQSLFYNDSSTSPYYNGLRFLPASCGQASSYPRITARALGADVNGARVVLLTRYDSGRVSRRVFCSDPRMVQPNDLALATTAGRVYISGQNYTADTVIGDGDLWMCEAPGYEVKRKPALATFLGVFGRTNGIEVSPDERTLYLSEAFNKDFKVISNVIWKFNINPSTGFVSGKTLFVDFMELDGSEAVDVDGMRTDVDGNLFVTRNGGGRVLKFSSEGKVLQTILLPGITNPTNLDLGGPNGTSLFVVGSCANFTDKGCVDVWNGNSVPGRAFSELNLLY